MFAQGPLAQGTRTAKGANFYGVSWAAHRYPRIPVLDLAHSPQAGVRLMTHVSF
jgi:hypothetical protein